jgi:two-component system alkaline phosphatase synthesis response regulator PhoP
MIHETDTIEEPRPKILLIENEVEQIAFFKHFLQRERYKVAIAQSRDEAIWALVKMASKKIKFFCIIDWMLPEISGVEVCRFIRSHPELKNSPIMGISANPNPDAGTHALLEGADDFMVKPFSAGEMLTRIKLLIRRCQIKKEKLSTKKILLSFGPLSFDSVRRDLFVDGKAISLTKTEFILLQYLIKHQGHPISKEELLSELWSDDNPVGDDNLKFHIYSLRKKLKDPPDRSRFIETLRGIGYRFKDQWEE